MLPDALLLMAETVVCNTHSCMSLIRSKTSVGQQLTSDKASGRNCAWEQMKHYKQSIGHLHLEGPQGHVLQVLVIVRRMSSLGKRLTSGGSSQGDWRAGMHSREAGGDDIVGLPLLARAAEVILKSTRANIGSASR